MLDTGRGVRVFIIGRSDMDFVNMFGVKRGKIRSVLLISNCFVQFYGMEL